MMRRPEASEYGEYFGRYVSLVPDGSIPDVLKAQTPSTLEALRAISEEKSLYRYAPGKWSLRESWLHVADAERIFMYRLLRFARTDPAELQSFDQDIYIEPSKADERSWASIIDELAAVRHATLHLLQNLPAGAWDRTGKVSGNAVSVRALAYVATGHEIHHLKVMRERYLGE